MKREKLKMRTEWRHKYTLYLTLKKKWFDRMITGEKTIEIRKPSKWLMSRISKTDYDKVRFTNGYGKNAPFFEVRYHGYYTLSEKTTFQWGNDSIVAEKGDIVIHLGYIITPLHNSSFTIHNS